MALDNVSAMLGPFGAYAFVASAIGLFAAFLYVFNFTSFFG